VDLSKLIEEANPTPPKPRPGAGKAATKEMKGLGHDAAKKVEGVIWANTVGPYLDDMNRSAQAYSDVLHSDAKAYPAGTGDQVLHSLKSANDILNYVFTPITSPVYTGVINPLKAGIAKLGKLVEAHAAEDVYDAEARREGDTSQKYPKGFDLAIHKADVKRTVEGLQDASEAFINAAVGVVAGEKMKAPERPVADTRVAVKDLKSALEPVAPPKLTPVSIALDKTMGFGKVADVVGKELQGLPAGSTRTAAAVLDSMLPHAEGFAKSFLMKLAEYIDPSIQILFKDRTVSKNPRNLGVWIPAWNQIQIKVGGADMVHTAVHEIVHAATTNMMDTLLEGELKEAKEQLGRNLTPEEQIRIINQPKSPVLKELDQIIKEARVRAQKAGREFYGLKRPPTGNQSSAGMIADRIMTPRREFIAELFSNPDLQEFLANSEKYASAGYKFKNILNQFGLMVAKHLGLENPSEKQLLNQAMSVGSRLLKMQAEEKPPTHRDIYQIVARTEDGGTITRGDIQRSTSERLADEQGVRRAKDALKISVEQILRAVSPESLGRNAKLAASVVSSRISEQMQKASAWHYGSDTRRKFWRARPDMVKEFINKFERGESFSDPVLQKLADKYRSWGAKIYEGDKKAGFDYEPRDNYLYHVFEDQEAVANYFQKKYGSKWGDPRFIKERSFDLYKEAVAAGFRPLFDNPEDIMLARQQASDIARMHSGILEDLASFGLATLKVKGKEEIVKSIDADQKVRFEVVKTEGNSQPEGTVRWRAPNGDVFWVDSQADQILQNAFKSYSLWGDKGGIGLGFRGMMALKNAIVPIRLAISLFHPLHVVGIDIAAGLTRGAADLLSGNNPGKALGDMLKSFPNAFYSGPKSGWRVMQAWRGKVPENLLNEADTEALHLITEGGMIPEMSSQFRTNARQSFTNALLDARGSWRQGKALGLAGDALRATWHLPWALLSAVSKPIFEDWIPALKTASYLKDAKALLGRNPELSEDAAARQLALRRLAKSVDNRYGEMSYNTLFWKRWVKDIAVLDTLSLGWQLGFLREYGGGALDLGRMATQAGKLEKVRKGELDRAIFVGAYTTLGAGVAGLMTWGMTGEQPSSLLDYISPRTGEKNPDGSDQRVSTMFYSREFASIYKHMQNEGVVSGISQTVLNKGSGLFGLMHEWATGVNGFGQEIRDPDSSAFAKVEQTLAYTLSDLEPISMKSLANSASDKPVKTGVLSVLGFTPAPKYLTESKTEASVKQAYDKYVQPRETPFDKAEYSKEYKSLRDAYQSGSEKYGDILDKMIDQYDLSGQDQRRLIRSLNSDIPPNVRMFMRLPWQEQKKLLDKMTPEERDDYLPHANKEHVRNVYEAPQ